MAVTTSSDNDAGYALLKPQELETDAGTVSGKVQRHWELDRKDDTFGRVLPLVKEAVDPILQFTAPISYATASEGYAQPEVIIDFGIESSKDVSQEINAAIIYLKDLKLPALNTIPSYNKIVLYFENTEEKQKSIKTLEIKMKDFRPLDIKRPYKRWNIPACYNLQYALDFERIQKLHDLSNQEIINLHTKKIYYNYYIGFMPGFPYLGEIPSKLITPRLSSPRLQIPARSVGIAKEHTCIYPKISPGGWNIIAQVPFDIFSLDHSRTSLFLPGDEVEFSAVTQGEFEKIQKKNFLFDEIMKEFSQ
jgi:KipI family sensor histidine kinase inhibitor